VVEAIKVLVKDFGIECVHGNQRSHPDVLEPARTGVKAWRIGDS